MLGFFFYERTNFFFDIYQNRLVTQSDQNICIYRLKRPGKVRLLDKIQ